MRGKCRTCGRGMRPVWEQTQSYVNGVMVDIPGYGYYRWSCSNPTHREQLSEITRYVGGQVSLSYASNTVKKHFLRESVRRCNDDKLTYFNNEYQLHLYREPEVIE